MQREVVVVSGVRTAIGDFGGALKDFPPTDLAARVVREALSRAKVSGEDVGHVVFGNVVHTEPKDMYLARVAAINGGVAQHAPALTVNRLCGSGLQAIVSAAQSILLGDADIAVAGGAENMSRAPYIMPAARFGQRMGDARIVDMMLGALNDPFDTIHMGVTAENVAAKYGITREAQDALALESHRRAAKAIEAGYFKEQILPITLASKKGETLFVQDEHVRMNATPEDFSKLKPVFAKENGTVTAGNASGINDAAAALVLMERSVAEKRGLAPLGRLVAYAHAGVDPKIMGIGPVPASKKALERAGLDGCGPRRHRSQRGFRRASVRRHERTEARSVEGQSERLGHFARASDWRDGRADHREGVVRTAARGRTVRAGDNVHRRRAGHRDDLRAHLNIAVEREGSRG